ncbi:MAG: class I SAM-dependent RNA methyltransferase [bacterium]|nr:class I SAM-dependent RNA methyltransferase [bacterium]
MTEYKMVAPCGFGIEGILADELRRLQANNVMAENGRVLFTGDGNMLARANICSRFAERILINVGSFHAESFSELFDAVRQLPFEEFIGKDDSFPVKGWCLNSQLHSVPDCQSIIKKAVVERLKTVYKIDWFSETKAKVQIQFSIMKNQVTIMIDTSGMGLHKRGYREKSNLAPIKETLAAAMCDQARIFSDTILYDPFCGSGTILIEAALMAKKKAPGINSFFAAQRFPFIDRRVWIEEKERARSFELDRVDFHAYGSDIDPECVKIARENARKAGVGELVSVEVADIKDFKICQDRAIVITNPPYGERLLDIAESERLYKEMGRVFSAQPNRKYFVISPHDQFEEFFGRCADKRRKLYNGMIKCQYYMYFRQK